MRLKGLRAFLFALLSAAVVYSAVPQDKIRILANDYGPFYGRDLPSFGPLIEIATLAFEAAGYEVSVDFEPWARVLEDGFEGKCDVIAGVWLNTGREDWMALSSPAIQNHIGLFERANDPTQFDGWADIAKKGAVVGVVKGYINPPALAAEGIKTEEVSEDILNVKKLVAGRIDLALMDYNLGFYLAESLGVKNRIKWLGTIQTLSLRMGFMKNAPGDWRKKLADFDLSLKKLERDGTVEAILARHGLTGHL